MSTPEQEPVKLTPTQRLHEVTMQALSRQPSQPESMVELSRNAKGDVQIVVTVRATDPGAAQSEAVAIFEQLREKYPRTTEATNGGGEA